MSEGAVTRVNDIIRIVKNGQTHDYMQVWLSFKTLFCSTLVMKLKNGFLPLYCHIKRRRTD